MISFKVLPSRFAFLLTLPLILLFNLQSSAQTVSNAPLTNQEFVQKLFQLPKHPELRDKLVEEIRQRGIDFPLTDGLKGLVATKSGSDPLLRRTLEEAARRKENPTAAALPPEAEAAELLAHTKIATLGAADTMPDFVVRQEISRSYSYARTNNWIPQDKLTLAVSYRAASGEEYKLLAVNGIPPATDPNGNTSYNDQVGGTTSSGEYVTMLADLFKDETRTDFKAVDTDTLRGRSTIVYDYVVKRENSHQQLTAKGIVNDSTISGYVGKIWVDRETFRVLRLEETATEIPTGFPITAASSAIDYDWVTIAEKKHLLPTRAEIKLTIRADKSRQQQESRNVIRFRDYQKYGTEVKIIEDTEPDEEPQKKP
jgi:hypothetical protein